MNPADRHLAEPRRVTLRDGRAITIRLLAGGDEEQFVEFYGSIPPEDGIYYISPGDRTPGKARERVAKLADSLYEVCLVLADDGGQIHGEAWFRWSEKQGERAVFGIAIRRTMQGAGAGRLIMSRLMELADAYGPPVLCLTVQSANERARRLYDSLGFVTVREQIRGTREDCPSPMPEFYMERLSKRYEVRPGTVHVGWASADLTPSEPVELRGQFHVRAGRTTG